ncbi:distal tail protein Dit [Lactococcus cremoris]|uniref:distal tail protein Dit n=1 Tax=Lactococcus lactis subsp. cremoris TaxID=1359 RepID=UPI0024A75BDA|nr:distal tail protein Dit [Lactococcus cremoris]
MTFSVSFNGVDISSLVNGFTGVTRNIGSTWANTTSQTSNTGVDFLYNSIGAKTITISFIAHVRKDRFSTTRRELAKLLNVSEPAPLIIGDEPNVVWYAVPDGSQTLDESSFFDGIGTLTFLVPSGIAESSFTQTLNADNSGGDNGSIVKNDDGSVDVTINNQGSLPAYPTFKFTHTSDNAYIGIAGEEGVMALGSQDQTLINTVTTETTKVKSQWLLNPGRKTSQSSNFSGHFVNASDVGNPQNGTLKTAGSLSFKKDGLRLASMGPNPSSGTWTFQGGMQVFNVPADSAGDVGTANFRSDINIWAQATKMGQTGLIQILYCDKNNKLLCGMGIYKDDTKGNTFQIHLYIGGNHQRTWKVFGPKGLELNNGGHGDGKVANPNSFFNSKEGNFTIEKKGEHFYYTFGNKGGTYSITVPEMATQQCSKVFVYIGQAKGRNMSSQYVTNLTLRRFSFQKEDVKKIIDDTTDATTFIPADDHHHGEGEIVVVNTADANIFRGAGSTFANDELITGGEFFPVPPGESVLSLVFGDDAATPDIEATWKERYL